ncbi:hypothetical protein [Flavipsychrobacter stenotrophus]|nr:hypothetical protein [Flavipsychrobacter stenotrophus]
MKDNADSAKFCNSCGAGLTVDDKEAARLKKWADYKNEDQPVVGKVVTCPKCGSESIHAYKKGYSAGKGCLMALLMLPFSVIMWVFGLLFGAVGANKIKRKCLQCNYTW